MAFGKNDNEGGGFAALINPVSVLLAICIAIAKTGSFYRASLPWVTDFIFREYGAASAQLAFYLWFPLVAVGLFVISRIIIAFVLHVIFVKLLGQLFG
jgi:hypothetical protein